MPAKYPLAADPLPMWHPAPGNGVRCLVSSVPFRQSVTPNRNASRCSGHTSIRQELPAMNPGNLQAKSFTQVRGCIVNAQSLHGGPEFDLPSRGPTLEAVIAIGRQVRRKNTASRGNRFVDRAWAAQLIAGSCRGEESDELENLRNRNARANHVKIDAGHEATPGKGSKD